MNRMQSEDICCQQDEDHRELLFHLKKSIDLWFLCKRDHLETCTNTGDGCIQICSAIRSIFLDGFRRKGVKDYEPKVSSFIENLNWLHPAISKVKQCHKSFKISSSSSERSDVSDELSKWIYDNIENSELCDKLKILVADVELLDKYYNENAYLCHEKYSTALLICLSAVELNQSSLLSQIDASLYSQNLIIPKHRRTYSHPHFSISPKKPSPCITEQLTNIQTGINGIQQQTKIPHNKRLTVKKNCKNDRDMKFSRKHIKPKPWKSLPDIRQVHIYQRSRSKTISQPINIPRTKRVVPTTFVSKEHSVPKFTYKPYTEADLNGRDVASTSRSITETPDLIPVQLVKCDDIKIYVDQRQTIQDNRPVTTPESSDTVITYDSPPSKIKFSHMNFLSCISSNIFSPSSIGNEADDIEKTKLMYANNPSTSSDFVGVFLPREGEKLRNRDGRKHLFEEIDEDTATNLNSIRVPVAGQSLASFLQAAQFSRNNTDLERENAHFNISEAMISAIEHMKWTNTERKRKKLESKLLMQKMKQQTKRRFLAHSLSEDRRSSSRISDNDSNYSDFSESTDDWGNTIDDQSNSSENSDDFLKKLTISTQNINDHAAFAEWGETNTDALSAEGIALSLLSKFSDTQLPSDLTWLVSEQDAPQELIPLPQSFNNSDDNVIHPLTRGTRDWAPPRPQIIFTNHPPLNRKIFMQKQNYRCAGCGMRIAVAYMHRYRYCFYFGKYHCTGCHRNQISTIPAKVLQSWDFTYYPVSMFAYRLLEQIWTYPLFYVPDLNEQLYKKIKNLDIARVKRIKLKYIKDFIITCRFANDERRLFDNIPYYLTTDPDIWAMSDFVATKDSSLRKSLDNVITKCEEHIYGCVLCAARGFICEICPKKQTIYPWQQKVKRCDDCGTCYHDKCWNTVLVCGKCQRLKKRLQTIS